MRELHFDLRRLQKDDRQGSYGSRRARCYVLAQAAETLHQLGYRFGRSSPVRPDPHYSRPQDTTMQGDGFFPCPP